MNKPAKPATGMPLECGYDRKLHNWIEELEYKLDDYFVNCMRQLTERLAISPGGGGGTGDNYFKVVYNGATYDVADGANESAENCGYVVIGNSRVAVPKVTGISASGTGAFYLKTTYSSAYMFEILFAASLPAAANGTDIKLVAELNSDVLRQRLFGEHTIVRWV